MSTKKRKYNTIGEKKVPGGKNLATPVYQMGMDGVSTYALLPVACRTPKFYVAHWYLVQVGSTHYFA